MPLAGEAYYYFGIKKTLNLFCTTYKINIQTNKEFLLAVNIGLPLSKSSDSSFWPILCSVKSIKILIKILIKHVFLIAYYGSGKSTNGFSKILLTNVSIYRLTEY